MTGSNWTGRAPRTSTEAFGCDGHAIEVHTTPLPKRLFFALVRNGWLLLVIALGAAVLTGCGEARDYGNAQADLADAISQAAKGGLHD